MNDLYQHCDLHVHTRLSPCGRDEMRVRDILSTCEARGIAYLGITDHFYEDTSMDIVHETRRELAAWRGTIQVFVGCEADILGVGKHVVTEEMRETLDFIAVSANHFHTATVSCPPRRPLDAVARHFLGMFEYACSLEFVDVIAHPMVVFPGTYDPECLDLLSDDDLMRAIRLAKANNVAMEISPRALMRDQIEFRLRFYALCKEVGIRFSIGSDAHSLENAGRTNVLAPLITALEIADEDIWLPAGS